MSDGLDVHVVDGGSNILPKHCSMVFSFASVRIANMLASGEYPNVNRIWQYAKVPVLPGDVPQLREEVTRLRAATQVFADLEIDRELAELISVCAEAETGEFGLCALGP